MPTSSTANHQALTGSAVATGSERKRIDDLLNALDKTHDDTRRSVSRQTESIIKPVTSCDQPAAGRGPSEP